MEASIEEGCSNISEAMTARKPIAVRESVAGERSLRGHENCSSCRIILTRGQ